MAEGSIISNGTVGEAPTNSVSRTQIPVAILGSACRLPGQCNSPRALWEFLARGSIAKNDPPESSCRFNLSGHYDGSGKPGTMPSPGGMFLEEVDLAAFDAGFFNLSRADATNMDPQQRLLLEVTYECLENSGVTLDQIRGTNVGCIVGSNSCEYEASTFRDPEDLAAGRSTGTSRSILSNRVSHFLDINGPSITVDTACSATMTAVDIACQYLTLGKADSMVVAGSTLYMDPITLQDPGPMKEAFSTSGKCHSFDAKADGYIRAEAVNAVFLKRLDEALRDRDPIRAIIRGTAVNSDGHTPGLTSPNPAAQAAAIRAAYRNAGITSFDDTGFLECHGTGTYSGDPLEIEGLASVFAPTRPVHKPLIIGSIKSNIGHSEAAAGLSGLIKAAMVVEKGIIPGNPTFITPNPRIDFEGSRVRVSRDATPWPKYAPIRRASVNSFGFGGSNGHCVLEAVDTHLETHGSSKTFISSFGEGSISSWIDGDYDDDETTGALGFRPLQLLTFSANDRDALTANVKAISNHLIHPAVTVSLADVAYTLSERRTHHFHRAFIVTDSTDFVTGTETVAKKRAEPPRVGFVFTGQGAQWSAMGKHLLSHFPLAKAIVAELDAALQTLPQPPSWSLLDELTQKREPDHLRRPEISQPLVTALQLALLRVLEHWGIRPESVVGHSSGEIAAAVAAGLIPADVAIKVAYLRGQAAVSRPPQQSLGMLAVGLSAEQVVAYLGTEPTLHIACFNSPSSLTISGPLADLERVRDRVQKDGHFARLLQVDLAYHSEYMADIAAEYERLLVECCAVAVEAGDNAVATDVSMISSVTGRAMEPGVRPDLDYWRRNMTSPVRFAQAATEMLSRPHGPEFLIEIGPSNGLSGPVAQVIAAMGSTSEVQYTSAAKRGPDTLLSLFDAVGKLWAHGGSVDLTRVNAYDQPSLVVDLPNYQWNHSNRYWHQGLASEEWRHRKFVSHDLLGSKIPGTSWKAPTWLRMIRLDDLPWLRDHEIAGQLLFPGTGFLAMAMEAAFQTTAVNEWSAYGSTQPASFTYHMENVQFLRGLELSETNAVRVMLALTPVYAPLKPWHEFSIRSVSNDGTSSTLHCTGLVRIVSEPASSRLPTAPPPGVMEPLKYPYSSDYCYSLMRGRGYHYGPHFQRLVEVEWTWGGARTLGTLSLAEPPSTYRQSRYPIHPVSLDSFLQFSGFSVRQRQKKLGGVESLVPGRIGSLVVAGGADARRASVARVALSAALGGQGKKERGTSYEVAGAAYDPDDGRCLLEMKGLRFTTLGPDVDVATSHSYARLAWDVDLSLTDEASLNRVLSGHTAGSGSWCRRILELVRHTNPAASVLEVAADPESASCLSLNGRDEDTAHFAAFHFVSNGLKQLLEIQDRHSTVPNATFQLLDATVPGTVISADQCDFAVLRVGPRSTARGMSTAIDNISRSLRGNGQLLLVHEADPSADMELQDAVALLRERFVSVKNISKGTCCLAALAQSPIPNPADKRQNGDQALVNPTIICLRFTQSNARSLAILNNLRNVGFIIHDHDANSLSEEHIPASSTVLCLDELSESVTATLTPACWSTLQSLIRTECHLLWVTSGAQGPGPRATHPDRAASHGLLRVLRAEEPHLRLLTLDVAEHSSEEASSAAVHTLLNALLQHADDSTHPAFAAENEFCAGLDGAIYTPRVVPDEDINAAKFEHVRGGRTAEPVDFATTERCIRLRAERPGMIDSLEYVEVQADANLDAELVCEEEEVEVEVYAVGANHKDVMLTLGLVDGAGEFSIGSEGAGVVTRVGRGVTSVRLGQRVVVIWPGMYANRVRVPARCVHRIPDGLSFADAATLPVAYLTALLGLRDLGGLKKGQRVLIHSATGGVGNAAVQLAKYIGAEIFATVGTAEKRKFLEGQGILSDHIFSSRSADFEKLILDKTGGHGIDVILNSLSGELLEASWNVIAYGGTFVEIGKRDIHDGSRLSMEPFKRAASFRAVDLMLHRVVDFDNIARLLHNLFELLEAGHIQPVFPVRTFSFDKVPNALHVLRTGTHMGKLVVSRDAGEALSIPVRPLPRQVKYRDDACYVVVGGLKGLGGSMAVELARGGANHVAALSRGGYDDEASKTVIHRVRSLGTHIDLLRGDITKIGDVREAFTQATVPIGGIIQGAMVLRDHPFSVMTIDDYHAALECKINGTWNLHKVALEQSLNLDFFTMLSSISSVLGSKAQANYAAGNAFLDAFSSYRLGLGLPANTINLGVIQDVGYIARNDDLLTRYSANITPYIGEDLLSRILQYSILQQTSDPVSPASRAQMITGLASPQPTDSSLRDDARFSHLFFSASPDTEQTGPYAADGSNGSGAGNQGLQQEVRELKLLFRSTNGATDVVVMKKTVAVVSAYLAKMLRLRDEALEPERPLLAYGIDSLAAVEFRNWVRRELGAVLSMADVSMSGSLLALCKEIVVKARGGEST